MRKPLEGSNPGVEVGSARSVFDRSPLLGLNYRVVAGDTEGGLARLAVEKLIPVVEARLSGIDCHGVVSNLDYDIRVCLEECREKDLVLHDSLRVHLCLAVVCVVGNDPAGIT